MPLVKASTLLRLAEFVAARYLGVTLREVAKAFDVSHRTAEDDVCRCPGVPQLNAGRGPSHRQRKAYPFESGGHIIL